MKNTLQKILVFMAITGAFHFAQAQNRTQCYEASRCIQSQECRQHPRASWDNIFYHAKRTLLTEYRTEHVCVRPNGPPIISYEIRTNRQIFHDYTSHRLWRRPQYISQIPQDVIYFSELNVQEKCEMGMEEKSFVTEYCY